MSAALLLVLTAARAAAAPAPETALCRGGAPLMPVVRAAGASKRTRRAARALADALGRACGRPFSVEVGDGTKGLALGTAEDFPALALGGEFDAPEPYRREQYVLRSREDGLAAVGAGDDAVEDAAADLRYRAGLRQFFPGPTWEVVPSRPDLSLSVSVKTAPAFATRRIWYGYGKSDYNRDAFNDWRSLNRLPGAFDLQSGHSYEAVIERHKAEFDAHPEYLALVDGKRVSTKLCLSNPAARRIVVEDAVSRFSEDPDQEVVSVEPSDGDGWCECEKCRALGTPSDRVLLVANEVSERLEKDHPGKYVSFYAYNRHSPPPSGRARPRVIVTVATSYLTEGRAPEELLRAWRERGVERLGLREYYGIFQWNRGLPGRMRGGDPAYLARTLPRFHELGAELVSAESGEDWGANGLGYYVASRVMWDLAEAGRVAEIREDFLDKAFGAAKEPMRAYYELIDGSRALKGDEVPGSLVAGMYARLAEARAASADPAVRARVDDLALYARYVELYKAYAESREGRAAAFARVVRHVRRMRGRMMVDLRALVEFMPASDRAAVVPADDGAAAYTAAEAARVLRDGAGRSAL